VLAPAINRTIAAREEQRRTHRFRQLAALAVSLLLVVSAIGIVIGYLYTTARTDAQLAQSRQLAAAADEKLATDPELSTLLALQALRVHYTSEAESALRQALPEGQELRKLGDRTTVIGTAFDPADPGKVVSGGGNGDSWIWNAATGQRLIRLRPTGGFRQQGTADAMAFNQAGTQVAVGYGAGAVGVFSVTTGAQLRLATPPGLVSRTVNHVAFVGSSSRLAVATDSGAFLEQPGLAWLKLAGPASGQSAESVAFDPRDAMRYAAAASDSTDLCEVRPGKTPRCSALLQGRVLANDVGYSPDGREVVTANQDGSVRLYNAVSGSWIRTLQAIDGDATSAQFSPAGTFVAASYTSGVTRIWDPASGLQVAQLAGSSSRINSASFGAGGREIATASSDGTTRIWRALPPELDKRFSASLSNTLPSPGYGVSYSPDGTRLAVVDASGNAYVVSATGQRRIELSGLGGRIRTARFSPDGSKVVTTVGSYVDQWYSASARFAHDPIYLGRSESATAAAYSPDGSRLVVVTSADVAQVRDAASGRLLATLNPHDGFQLEGAAFRPGGRQILTVDAGGQALAWDAVTGHRVRALPKAGAPIYDVQFNRAGSRFVTAVGNDELTVWSAVTDRQLRVIPGCPTPNTASFSPDGTKVVAACSDGAARVFATRSGKLLSVLTAQGLVNEAEFSPDGRQIATAFGAQGTGGFAVWSSQLTTPSLPRLERLARKRVDRVFTTAEQAALISAAIGS
jgi:WD40 repeat protein